VLLILIIVHGAVRHVARHRPQQLRLALEIIFSCLYFAFIALIAANVISLYMTGNSFDLNWLFYVKSSASGSAVAVTLSGVLSRNMVVLAAGCLVGAPLLSLLFHRRFRPHVRHYVGAGLLLAGLSAGLAAALPADKDRFAQAQKTRNPVARTLQGALFPSLMQRQLAGVEGADPHAEARIDARDWMPPTQPAPVACCKGMNIVLITLDSVSLTSVARDDVLRHASDYPNLAMLYGRGVAFDKFYANYPSSTEALGIMLGSVYASNALLSTNVDEWTGKDVSLLPTTLAANGYHAAHFMSGDLAFGGVRQFLTGRGFSTIEDSYSLTCSANDDRLRATYTHIGDDCTARAASRWIADAPPSPFFLWVWFTNPHTPYFTRTSLADGRSSRSRSRHVQAIRETDAAIGRVIQSLVARKLMDRTVIVLLADHGEAFGQHGQYYHGTALYEEQIHIPLIISAPGLAGNRVVHMPGSTIDLAPTIAGLVGVRAPAAWQGRSLFAASRPQRVYFTALSAGRMAGYREGNRKYILSSANDRPLAFDLQADPGERRPLPLSTGMQRIVAARLNAFIRTRNAMRWPMPQKVATGPPISAR
jgi:lipoteichoic acid synthase